MKSVTFDEARAKFESLFDLASQGELILVVRDQQRVALQSIPFFAGPEVAPPGFFADDYDAAEIDELNALATHGPGTPLP